MPIREIETSRTGEAATGMENETVGGRIVVAIVRKIAGTSDQ